MRRVLSFALALWTCAAAAGLTPAGLAQSRPQPTPGPTDAKGDGAPKAAGGAGKGGDKREDGAAREGPDKKAAGDAGSAEGKSAQALYEEAASYARRKFEEFEAKQIPFNELLRHEVLHDQRKLAESHVAALSARGALAGEDLYYAGLLYLLAGRGPAALDAMRRFLAAGGATPALKQKARAVVGQQAAQAELFAEAERALADYQAGEPRTPSEADNIRIVLANAYAKKKDYVRAAAHAREAFTSAVASAADAPAGARNRGAAVYGPGAFLANTLSKAGRRDEALAVIQQMRTLALTLPNARLYGDATGMLLNHGGGIDAPPPPAAGPAAPELKIKEWIDQQPVTLAGLRGSVVLLDFWATWCGPCRITIPKLNALHRKYKDRGLVILGLTEFYGRGEGRALTPAEELLFLRRFKREHQVTYGFAVADHEENGHNYGVASLPTAVLLDRRGRVRFITVSAADEEARALTRMIETLIEEKP